MWLDSLLNLIFPPSCEVCRGSSPEPLCADCFAKVKFIKPQSGVCSASVYDDVMRLAIHRFKFQKRKALAEPLGVLLVKYLSFNPALRMEEIDFLAPIPLHLKRQRERGFNQVELLARIVSRYFEVPVSNILERTRDTHPQFNLPREKRLNNLKGAFKVTRKDLVEGRSFLLLDDIYTTGATVSECRKVLKEAGAGRVEVATLARAVDS